MKKMWERRSHAFQPHYTQWRNWQGGKGASRPPGKLNVKTGFPPVDILIFSILQVVDFLRASGCFFVFFANTDIHDIQKLTIIS